MGPNRVLTIMNVSLGLVSVLLLLNLLGIELPTVGQAQYLLDKDDPLCIIKSGEQTTAWNNLDRCCLEARKQALCLREINQLDQGKTDWTCSAGKSGYLLNNKAYNYCRQQPYW